MFKCKAYFEDGSMEYVLVACYGEGDIPLLIESEFYDRNLMTFDDIQRVSDSSEVMALSVDAYDAIEAC